MYCAISVSSLIKNNFKDVFGDTALHYACENGHINIVEPLLQHPSIDINLLDNYKRTPMHQAKNHGHLNIVNLLVHHECKRPKMMGFFGYFGSFLTVSTRKN